MAILNAARPSLLIEVKHQRVPIGGPEVGRVLTRHGFSHVDFTRQYSKELSSRSTLRADVTPTSIGSTLRFSSVDDCVIGSDELTGQQLHKTTQIAKGVMHELLGDLELEARQAQLQ